MNFKEDLLVMTWWLIGTQRGACEVEVWGTFEARTYRDAFRADVGTSSAAGSGVAAAGAGF